jgi:tripartite-type tricarboxylate transporter receptor subunit TctC
MLKKEPASYSYASSGNGGLIHLAGYLLLERAAVQALHVPYRGSAPGMIDTIAGRHAFQVDTLGLEPRASSRAASSRCWR